MKIRKTVTVDCEIEAIIDPEDIRDGLFDAKYRAEEAATSRTACELLAAVWSVVTAIPDDVLHRLEPKQREVVCEALGKLVARIRESTP